MLTTITVTQKQLEELAELTTLNEEWFERLGDITGCPPHYLRTRVNEDVSIEKVPMRILQDFKCREDDVLWLIGPVEDEPHNIQSGVLEEIR